MNYGIVQQLTSPGRRALGAVDFEESLPRWTERSISTQEEKPMTAPAAAPASPSWRQCARSRAAPRGRRLRGRQGREPRRADARPACRCPTGFVIGAPAYAAFCEQTGLRERLAELLDGVDVEDTAALQAAQRAPRASCSTRRRCPSGCAGRSAPPTSELVGRATAEAPVAVRSSATAEDTAAASFAGMNETFLERPRRRRRDRRGAPLLALAVRRPHDLLPRRRGFSQAEMDIAVVVQRQIASTRAGVMFTVNPATRRARASS